jgi:coronin-7
MIPSTIVGAGMVPATEVDVMRGEINRLFVLTGRDEIIPVSVRIERKSYMDFHGDLFPDVFVPAVGITGKPWLESANGTREKVSLDPEKQEWRTKEMKLNALALLTEHTP